MKEALKPVAKAFYSYFFTHLDTAPLALFAGLLRPRLAADSAAGAANLTQTHKKKKEKGEEHKRKQRKTQQKNNDEKTAKRETRKKEKSMKFSKKKRRNFPPLL